MASPASLFGEELIAGEEVPPGEHGGVLRKARPKEVALKSLPPLTDNASKVEGTPSAAAEPVDGEPLRSSTTVAPLRSAPPSLP
jgi:hypothetical protein